MIDFNKRKIYTIDNFIPTSYQDYLHKKYTCNSWWYLDGLDRDTSYPDYEKQCMFIDPDNPILDNVEEHFQLVFETYHGARNIFREGDLNPLFLIHYLEVHSNFLFKLYPQRTKINLQPNNPNFKETSHNAPHVDMGEYNPQHWTMIYYIKDSDGDTLIFKEKLNDIPVKNFTIDEKVSPKKGRAVIFPGDRFHCGTTPIISKARMVANINFTVEFHKFKVD